MKISLFRKLIVTGAAVSAVALTPGLRADVEVVIAGGNASSSVLFNRATNVLSGGITQTYGLSSSTVRSYQGTISGQPGLGTVTIDYVLNGAVGGLQDIEAQNPQTTAIPGDNTLPPTLVDSSTSPGAVALDPSVLTPLPAYVVPYVFIKNFGASSTDSATITNLTARQAAYLEGAGATLPSSFFGGAGTNPVYFIGRNNQSAVRTETDLNIGFTGTLKTYYTNAAGGNVPILDTTSVDASGNPDPGLSSGSVLYNTVIVVSNSIGNVAVSNAKSGAARLTYEGVSYSYNNVINGSYPLWYYESYFYKNTGAGQPTAAQQTVINLFYQSVTNAAFTIDPVYTNSYIPEPALTVKRGFDGGPITLK